MNQIRLLLLLISFHLSYCDHNEITLDKIVRHHQYQVLDNDFEQLKKEFYKSNPHLRHRKPAPTKIHKTFSISIPMQNIIATTLGCAVISLAKHSMYNDLNDIEKSSLDFLEKLLWSAAGVFNLINLQTMMHTTAPVPPVPLETTVDDIAGDLPPEIKQIITFLKDKEFYQYLYGKIKLPRGILLYGPPGTGKTLLAKALARELEGEFIYIKMSDIASKWIGETEKNIANVFKRARRNGDLNIPTIIFIDEIDSFGNRSTDSNEHNKKMLNQLLQEMDGFEPLKHCLVIGATNTPENIDPALLRAGRFDFKIKLTLPDKKKRKKIIKTHAKKLQLDPWTINFEFLARETEGMNCADLANLVNTAALNAMLEQACIITHAHFQKALASLKHQQ